MTLIQWFDIIGTSFFAISGALTAMNRRLDLFGVLIISAVTAVGGGTLRDLLIDQPVAWMYDLKYPLAVSIGYMLALLFRERFLQLRKTFFIFDTIGLGIFTIIGLEKGLHFGIHPVICIILGMMTGSFGGVIRDILCNEVPLIFHKEIYALASVIGGVVFLLLHMADVNKDFMYVLTVFIVIFIRIVAVKYNIGLPAPHYDQT